MWLNYLPVKWLKAFLDWLSGKNDKKQLEELKEVLPEKPVLEAPPPPVIKKGTLEDIRDYCEEVRGTLHIYKQTCDKIARFLWTYKKIVDDLYVEMGNLKGKIEKFLEAERRK